jgi:DNA primase
MGLTAIAPQSETSDIPEKIIDDIRLRSKKLIILYDNDYTGIQQSKKYANKYNCRYIILPDDNKNKDVAEYVKHYGLDKTKEIILKSKQLII